MIPADSAKPPYRVPPMAEIAAVPWNGLTVATFFAGCGGSSTGYRMAGFRVLYANEFVPAAQDSYRANCRPGTVVDGRDVKEVTAEDVLRACGLKIGELDVLDGSPPCQAFSTAGKREKGWGTEKRYEHGAQQMNERLFDEYIRIRDGVMPRAFVAENVSGLVKGTAKGFFIDIMKKLKRGYRVSAPLLDAQWLGVPQARQRIVIIGVREDLGVDPPTIRPLPYRYSVREAIPWIDRAHHDTGGSFKSGGDITDRPSVTIMSSPRDANHFKVEARVVVGRGGSQRAREEGKPVDLDEPSPAVLAGGGRDKKEPQFSVEIVGNSNAAHSRKGERRSADEPSRTILARRVNLEIASTPEPETDISGQAIGAEYDRLSPGQQSDKYFSLVRAHPDAPSPTITAAGGQNAGIACVVHPTEKRKFSILEVKRLCSFPDDFELKGTYAQQWERLGNSVPPVMMFHVARTLRDEVFPKIRRPAGRRGRSRTS